MSSSSSTSRIPPELWAKAIAMSGNGARAAQASHLFRTHAREAAAAIYDALVKFNDSPIGEGLKDKVSRRAQERTGDGSLVPEDPIQSKWSDLQKMRGELVVELADRNPFMLHLEDPEWKERTTREALGGRGFASLSCRDLDFLFKVTRRALNAFELRFIQLYAASRVGEIEELAELHHDLQRAETLDLKYTAFLDWRQSEEGRRVFQRFTEEARDNPGLFWTQAALIGGRPTVTERGIPIVCMPELILDEIGGAARGLVALSALGMRDLDRIAELWEIAPFRPFLFPGALIDFPQFAIDYLVDSVLTLDRSEIVPLFNGLLQVARSSHVEPELAATLLKCKNSENIGPACFACYIRLMREMIGQHPSHADYIRFLAELEEEILEYPRRGEMPRALLPPT